MSINSNPRKFNCTACADVGYMTFSFGRVDCYLCKPATVLDPRDTTVTHQPQQGGSNDQGPQGDGQAPEPA